MDDLSLRAFSLVALVLTSPWTYLVLFGLGCGMVGYWLRHYLDHRITKRQFGRVMAEIPQLDIRGALRAGKQFRAFCEFTREVEQGKRAMILGENYVVLSKNVYDDLQCRAQGHEYRS